jgi:signal transduction protein with GAF and PtsI domain
MREVMASPEPPQQKLDQMVRVIANNMVAEVCSIYLVRAGDILELFATVGLNAEAVHKTNLRVGACRSTWPTPSPIRISPTGQRRARTSTIR